MVDQRAVFSISFNKLGKSVWVSLVSALLFSSFFLTLFILPLDRKYVVIDLETNRPSFIKIFWSSQISEKYSEKRAALAGTDEGRHRYRLHIDGRTPIKKLRIDPSAKEQASVIIYHLYIEQPGLATQRFNSSNLTELATAHQLSVEASTDSSIHLITTGRDSQLELMLSNAPKEGLARILDYVKRFMIRLACSLVLTGSIVFGVVLTRGCLNRSRIFFKNRQTLLLSGPGSYQTPIQRWWPTLGLLAFTCVVAVLSQSLFEAYGRANLFGTNSAPYSDALMWLRGTLHYLDDLPFKTYRPTVNLFFGSLYSAFQQIHFIPLFSVVFFVCNLLLFFVFGGTEIRLTLLCASVLLLYFFDQLVLPLNVGQIMIDFLPFLLSIFGVLLVGMSLRAADNKETVSLFFGYLGLLFLGVATAVRGIPLMSGMILLVPIVMVLRRRLGWSAALGAIIAFLAPLLLDIYLQRKFGAENNALFSFFCFYHDPHHSYTRAGKYLLRKLDITSSEILITYTRFILSFNGLAVLGGYLQDIGNYALRIIQSGFFYSLMSFVLLGTVISDKLRGRGVSPFLVAKAFTLIVLLPLLLFLFPKHGPATLYIYALVIACFSLFLRQYITFALQALFLGGALLFAMMGMPGGERVLCGFIFAMPLSLLTFIGESEFYCVSRQKVLPLGVLMLVNISMVLFLYIGTFVLPEPAVAGLKKNTVIKLAEDRGLDRSLFYAFGGEVFYMKAGDGRVGDTRSVKEIRCPNGNFNPSFESPCTIE